MLVLTRHVAETVRIGDEIVITVLPDKGKGGVRLGIDAPPHVKVLRGEVFERMTQDNLDRLRDAGL